MRDWTDTIVEVATFMAVCAARARVAAGKTTAVEECSGVGRTCAEVRALAEADLRAWQSLDDEQVRTGGLAMARWLERKGAGRPVFWDILNVRAENPG